MPLFRNKSPEAHWSKDYIEHLRSVHFFLILAAVTGIVFGLTPTKAERQKAQHQLRTIVAFIVEQQQHVQDEEKKATEPSGGEFLTFKVAERGYFVETPELIRLIPACEHTTGQTSPVAVDSDTWQHDFVKMQYLAQFIAKWNATQCDAGGLLVATSIVGAAVGNFQSPSLLTKFSGDSSKLLQQNYRFARTALRIPSWNENVDVSNLISVAVNLRESPIQTRIANSNSEGQSFYGLHILGLPFYIVVRGLYQRVDANLFAFQNPSFDYDPEDTSVTTGPQMPCRGDFKSCFPELSRVTLDKQSWTLKDVSEAVDSEVANAERQFELGGIKFPSEDLSAGGIILLIVVLAYFFLHLRELSPHLRPTDSGLEVAWLGLYSSWLAYALVWISVLLVPAYAVGLLGVKGAEYEGPLWAAVKSNWRMLSVWIGLPFLVAVVLGTLSCRSARRLALLAADAFAKEDATALPESTPALTTTADSNADSSSDGLGSQ